MSTASEMMLRAERLEKSFTLHLQQGTRLDVLSDVDLEVRSFECVALAGPSGVGKSTLIRSLFGTYRSDHGHILVRHRGALIDIASASPRTVLAVRRETLGYVSQFLRVVPRVATLDVVAEVLVARGIDHEQAREAAADMLLRFNIPRRLHHLPPATFSGGEQQRVNLARGFTGGYPVLLLDEPTASLDADNIRNVVQMIGAARAHGTAIVAIMHDTAARDAVADRLFHVLPGQDAA